MRIPEAFKSAQKRIFCDKTVNHYMPVKVTGSLGSITQKPGAEVSGSYVMNFQRVSSERKAQEWGLQMSKDATASTSEKLDIKEDDYLQYDGVMYRIVKILKHDSHTRYLCKAVE